MLFRDEHEEKSETVLERDSNGFKSDEQHAKAGAQKRHFAEERYPQVSRSTKTVARFSLPRDCEQR